MRHVASNIGYQMSTGDQPSNHDEVDSRWVASSGQTHVFVVGTKKEEEALGHLIYR